MNNINELTSRLNELKLKNQNRRIDYYNGRQLIQMQVSQILQKNNMTLSIQLAKTHSKFNILPQILDRLRHYHIQGVKIQLTNTHDFKNGIFEMKKIYQSILKPHLDIINDAYKVQIYRVIAYKLLQIYNLVLDNKMDID